MQKARGHPVSEPCGTETRLPLIVGIGFQVLFHSPPGVLFTFPSRYLFTISQPVVFSLRRWSSQIRTGFLVPRATWELHRRRCPGFRLQGFHLLWLAFPGQFGYPEHFLTSSPLGSRRGEVPLPDSGNGCRLCHPSRLGSSPFARRYSGNRFCFLFLRVLRCFTSPGSPPPCGGFPDFFGDGFPIRESPGQRLCAPHRRLSQLTTPFIASGC
jgi:hypothetical protein